TEIIEPKTRSWRVGATMFSAAGLLALLVAAVGVYSSISYSMSQRSHEMGVRIALGANVKNIAQLVVRDGVRSVAIGVGLGIVASLMLSQFVSALLYNTSPRDPVVLSVSAITLLLVAVSACLIPAMRAARVDPLTAMRTE
ncbi:MAG: FtsX-like permease family protein, partial [Gemmatimonadaceae bacterium]